MPISSRRQLSVLSALWVALSVGPLGVGCTSRGDTDQTVEAEQTPAERAEALKLELGAAHRAWSEGNRAEAQERVRTAYVEHFEPLEEQLRGVDALGTLQLEYAFGRLERTFSEPGNPVVVIEEVRALNRDIEAAIAKLPVDGQGSEPAEG